MSLSSAASFSDYFETAILNWFKGTTFPTAPTTLYVGLFTANPADTGTTGGTADGTEVTTANTSAGFGAAYARVPITASSGFSAIGAASGDSTGQQISNAALLPASGAAWTNASGGTTSVTGEGIWDA